MSKQSDSNERPSSKQASDEETGFPIWPKDREELEGRILGNPHPIKVAVKVRDDFEMLSDFVKHYESMGEEVGLIVMDNMSSDPRTKSLLSQLSPRHLVLRFEGFHNKVHDSRFFHGLHQAIAGSSAYYAFLDVDELAVWIDSDLRVRKGLSFSETLLSQDSPFIPGIWLENRPFAHRDFTLDLTTEASTRQFVAGIRKGKPFISSKLRLSKVDFARIHNYQFTEELGRPVLAGNLYLLHMKNLDPRLRIQGNLNKLRNYNAVLGKLNHVGLFGPNFSLEQLMNATGELKFNGTTGRYLEEIWMLTKARIPEEVFDSSCFFSILDDLTFFSESQENVRKFEEFLSSPSELISLALGV